MTVKNDNICTYFVLSFMLSFLGCYHLCYHLMLSYFTVSKFYHFYVIIFPCTYFVLSFLLSFDVTIYCYHFPPFFFFMKTWHTQSVSEPILHCVPLPLKNHLWSLKDRYACLPFHESKRTHLLDYSQSGTISAFHRWPVPLGTIYRNPEAPGLK